MKSPNNLFANLLDIPEVQRLNLRLMELASFNDFDGPKVVKSLLENKDLWQACVMDREAFLNVELANSRKCSTAICLIKLRDMGEETTKRLGRGCWSVDTLFIIPALNKENRPTWKGKIEDKLLKLAKTWNPDEADWIEWPKSGKLMGGYRHKGTRILRVWWD